MPTGSAKHRICHTTAQTCACFNLRKVTRAVTQFYDQALRPTGLRATQFTLLNAVALLSPVTVSRLAHGLVMDRTTLTRDLGLLADRGLVLIEEGEDRRRRQVSLTPKGEGLLAKAHPLWDRAQSRVRNKIGAERLGRLLKDLAAVVDAVRPT